MPLLERINNSYVFLVEYL